MLTPRTQAIKDSLFAKSRVIDLERALLYQESYEQTQGEPAILRRAKALVHLLDAEQLSYLFLVLPGHLLQHFHSIAAQQHTVR